MSINKEQATKFIHSIKVHRLYKTAAKIIRQVCEEGKGVKHLLFEQTRVNIKTLNALVFETLRHAEQIDLLLRKSSLLINEPRLDPWLARVLMTELLWGQKDKLKSEAKPVKTILSYDKKFLAILRDNDVEIPEPVKQVYHPRYVRVNTLTMIIQDAVNGFRDQGWTLMRPGDNWTYQDFLTAVRELQPDTFIMDFHIPELLVFPPGTHFHDYQCYLEGHIVLQDKASCMAAHLLAPEPGSNVLDMCSAPGMKTTHLAAILGNRGNVYAVERDPRRYGILSEIVIATNSTCVKTINEDVLKIRNEQCPDVEYILVDPSCSGSGMLDRIESTSSHKYVDEKRLKSLSGFQILILRHALTAYPKAKRVIYSTCSIMPQENEQVVKEVLETTKQFRLVPIKDLLKKDWLSFGSEDYKEVGEKCLYAKSDTDYTNGFFMAVFERVAPHDDRDLYIRGRKWKQEPETNEDLENGDMVNYVQENGKGKIKKEQYDTDVKLEDEKNIDDDDIVSIKKSKKCKKRKHDGNLENENSLTDDIKLELIKGVKVKKSKKPKHEENFENHECKNELLDEVKIESEIKVKKSKKSKILQHEDDVEIKTEPDDTEQKKAKKCKKSKNHDRENEVSEDMNLELSDKDKVKKCKKSKKSKSKHIDEDENDADVNIDEGSMKKEKI